MYPENLKSLESRLLEPLPIPVIGRCLQKKAVTALVEDNSPDAVKVLAKAVTSLTDEEIKEIVLNALSNIRNQQCIDAFCEVWADTRQRDLANFLVKKGWIASAPVDVRVLSALKTKKLQVITNGGEKIVEPLLNAFQDRDSEIANRASECAISLTNPDDIDYICCKWAETRDKLLEQIICGGKYIAQQSIELRVLTALKVAKLEVIRDGDTEIVEPLLKAFNDKDAEIASNASKCAISLTNLETIDYICRLVIEQEHQVAYQIAIQAQYTPHEPNQRALFYFLTEQWNKYESLDYENTLLQEAYELGNGKLRKQIADKARQAGRVAWVQIVAGGRKDKRLGEMTDAEWETTLAVLNTNKQWDKMWQLAQKAPAFWSKQLLQQLEQAEWLPTVREEREGFERLKHLADKCLKKIRSMERLTVMRNITVRHNGVKQTMLSPNGTILVSSDKTTIKLWQMSDGKCLATLKATDYEIKKWSFSPNGTILVSSDKTTIKLWQMSDGKCLATLKATDYEIKQWSFSPDGTILASRDEKAITLWQIPDGQTLANLSLNHNMFLPGSGFSFSPDGTMLVIFFDCCGIELWRIPDGQYLTTLHESRLSQFEEFNFSPDGKIFNFVSSSDKTTIMMQSLASALFLPVEKLCQQNREWIQKTLQDNEMSKEEKHWLEFMQALMNWHQRFDMEVEDAPQLLSSGEFDIEIEG
jgi:virulence-associated protein VagC